MRIDPAQPEDWESIWPFFREIVRAGETYAYDRAIDKAGGEQIWMQSPPGQTFVARDSSGAVLGSASVYPNRAGGGSHVASASFMVDPRFSGQGTGRALAEHVLEWVRNAGYEAIQFNAVVETNTRAVALWESLGFQRLATVPRAFKHPLQGHVGLLIMHRFL